MSVSRGQLSHDEFMFLAGFLLALLLDRCLYIDFPLFNDYFVHELNFNWGDHRARFLGHGHDPDSAENEPLQLPQSGSSTAAGQEHF